MSATAGWTALVLGVLVLVAPPPSKGTSAVDAAANVPAAQNRPNRSDAGRRDTVRSEPPSRTETATNQPKPTDDADARETPDDAEMQPAASLPAPKKETPAPEQATREAPQPDRPSKTPPELPFLPLGLNPKQPAESVRPSASAPRLPLVDEPGVPTQAEAVEAVPDEPAVSSQSDTASSGAEEALPAGEASKAAEERATATAEPERKKRSAADAGQTVEREPTERLAASAESPGRKRSLAQSGRPAGPAPTVPLEAEPQPTNQGKPLDDGWRASRRPLPEPPDRKKLAAVPPRPKRLEPVSRAELGLERASLPPAGSVPESGVSRVQLTARFPRQVEAGRRFVVEVAVTDEESATGRVLVCLPVPKECRVVGAEPRPEWRAEGLVWQPDRLSSGQARRFRVELEAAQPGRVSFRPRVLGSLRAAHTVQVLAPKLVLHIRTPARPVLGQTYRVLFRMSNDGTAPAEHVVLQADLPPQLDYPYGRLLQYEVGKLAPGESREARLTARVVRPGPVVVRARLVLDGQPLQEVVRRAAGAKP